MNDVFEGKSILITGGTGSLGRVIAKQLLNYHPAAIRIFSNDEDSIFRTGQEFKNNKEFRYLLGNIAEKERLARAMEDVDIVFHTAALKHVQICEYNPFEAVKTNIYGMQNVIDTAIEADVDRVLFTSSDKAVNPSNTMGISKLMGEKLITTANFFKGKHKTIFSTIRLGNVLGSRGSVINIFKKQIECGDPLTITHRQMSRYILTIDEAINIIFKLMCISKGGEIFIPKMRAIDITTLANAMCEELGAGKKEFKEVGLTPGEKLYEELITEEETTRTYELDDMYVVLPMIQEFQVTDYSIYESNRKVKEVLRSDNALKLSESELLTLLKSENLL